MSRYSGETVVNNAFLKKKKVVGKEEQKKNNSSIIDKYKESFKEKENNLSKN